MDKDRSGNLIHQVRTTYFDGQYFSQSIEDYLADEAQNDVLRTHQVAVMRDIADFFASGDLAGDIEMPTGTGKTVVFVELCKALQHNQVSDQDGRRPRILVVTPTKDLVYQTLGQSGQHKGFGHFAPDIKVTSWFSDSSEKERAKFFESDVVVTTYKSLHSLAKDLHNDNVDARVKVREYLDKNRGGDLNEAGIAIRSIINETGKRRLDSFDIFIFDEDHMATGARIREIITTHLGDKRLIGLSATPDGLAENRKISKVFPHRIHTLSMNEAINWKLLSPVTVGALPSGLKIVGKNIFNDNGDYVDNTLRSLMYDRDRNNKIAQSAKILTEAGLGTIISCIPGQEQWHPKALAAMLDQMGVKAAPVHQGVSAHQRQELYRQFEAGKIDVLTYIGVLGVGWDSQRAQAIVNGRPTRSPIVAKQRLGRILRENPDKLAFAIDIQDEFEEGVEPISLADVLDADELKIGKIVGDDSARSSYAPLLDRLNNELRLQTSHGLFRERIQAIQKLPLLVRGRYNEPSPERKNGTPFGLPSKISARFSGVTEDMLLKIAAENGQLPITRQARTASMVSRTVYEIDQATQWLRNIKTVNEKRYYNRGQTRYIAAEGLNILFGHRYPGLKPNEIDALLANNDELPWTVGKTETYTEKTNQATKFTTSYYRVLKLYELNDKTQEVIDRILSEHTQKSD